MKKILAILVSAVMALSLTACSDGNEDPARPDKESSSKHKDSSYSGDISGDDDPFEDLNSDDEPLQEPVKPLTMWDILPEIEVTPVSEFKYEYDSSLGGIIVTDYTGESIRVRIPDKFDGEPVVGIDFDSVEKELTEIVVPETVKIFNISRKIYNAIKYVNVPSGIEESRLSWEPNNDDHLSLTGVYISNGMTEIGSNFFVNLTSLTSVNIPNSVTEIGRSAFSHCTSLTSVTIPNSVTEIDRWAFVGCTNLKSVTIPNSVTEIGYETFAGCTSLASVTIPNSVTKIDYSAFIGCTSLTNATYKGKSYDYAHIKDLYKAINIR